MPRPGKGHQETIALIKQGKGNREIADALGIPMSTVRSRRHRWQKEQITVATADPKTTDISAIQPELPPPLPVATIESNQADNVVHLHPIDGGKDDEALPDFALLKRTIWRHCQRPTEGTGVAVQALNCYLRALQVEQGVPVDDSEGQELELTQSEREARIAAILERGGLG